MSKTVKNYETPNESSVDQWIHGFYSLERFSVSNLLLVKNKVIPLLADKVFEILSTLSVVRPRSFGPVLSIKIDPESLHFI